MGHLPLLDALLSFFKYKHKNQPYFNCPLAFLSLIISMWFVGHGFESHTKSTFGASKSYVKVCLYMKKQILSNSKIANLFLQFPECKSSILPQQIDILSLKHSPNWTKYISLNQFNYFVLIGCDKYKHSKSII